MKKLFRTILAMLAACVALVCLFGCQDSKIDGKYLFEMAGGQADGPLVKITDKDENGFYTNVVNGVFNPENFWVEIKGDTMTIHGLIDPVGSGGGLNLP